MATNSTGSNSSCPEWYFEAGNKAKFVSFYVITPMYFIIGVPLHSICLKAFMAEVKKDKGYLYQVYLMASRLCETILFSFFVVGFYWLAYNTSPSTAWLHSCYSCMWFAVKVTPALAAVSVTVLMLFSILLCADRCYALWKPFSYRASYANRNNRLIVLLFIFVAIPINLAQLMNFTVEPIGDDSSRYNLVSNNAFKYSLLGRFAYHLRTVQEGSGLVLLYVCNTAMILLFRIRKLEAKKTLNRSNDMKKREETERMLTQLAIAQSLCFTVSVTFKAVNAALISLNPSYYPCQGYFYQALLISTMELTDLLDFFCVFALNKRFRKTIRKNLPLWCTIGGVPIAPTGPIVGEGIQLQ